MPRRNLSSATNPELCDEFRRALTVGCPEWVRRDTRAWRNYLWTLLREVDHRLNPSTPEGNPRNSNKEPTL